MTALRFLFRVTLRRLDLAAEIYHIKEPQKSPLGDRGLTNFSGEHPHSGLARLISRISRRISSGMHFRYTNHLVVRRFIFRIVPNNLYVMPFAGFGEAAYAIL